MIKQIKETIAVTHLNITIYVRIDYINGKIDIVDPVRNNLNSKFELKKFIFAQRGLGFMQGWQDIIDSIKHAITVAKERLTAYNEIEEENKAKNIFEMLNTTKPD